jgi:hypothetical protein
VHIIAFSEFTSHSKSGNLLASPSRPPMIFMEACSCIWGGLPLAAVGILPIMASCFCFDGLSTIIEAIPGLAENNSVALQYDAGSLDAVALDENV